MASRKSSDQYPSDLTDAEWKQIESIFDRFRFDEHDPRSLLNAVSYILKTGSQWGMLPKGFPPWQTVYYHFRSRLGTKIRLTESGDRGLQYGTVQP